MKPSSSIFLAFLALTLAFVALPFQGAAKDKCDCGSLKTLQAELRNAIKLQEAFRNKANELRALGKGASGIALKQFAEGDARRGLEPIPGNKGPSEVDYIPWGRDLYDASGNKHSAEQLCNMTPSSIGALEAAIKNAECPGIGEALRAHEKTHINFCKKIGFLPYEDMHGADRAMEEVEAYGAQIKVLRDTIASLRCGYRVNEQFGPTNWSGTICSLENPFTLNGSNPVVKFTLEFTPSSVTSGTWSLKTSIAAPASAFGSGTYKIEGANTETPRLVLAGSDTVTAMGRSANVSHNPGNVKLIPLDTGECSQPQK